MAEIKKDIKKEAAQPATTTTEKATKQDSRFKKFVLPVLKLSAVAGVVGGAIGATAAVTYENIETNKYEFKLESYMGMTKEFNGWTRGTENNFYIYGKEVKTGDRGQGKMVDGLPANVSEYMTFCTNSVKIDCVAGDEASSDLAAIAITTKSKFEYGEMEMQILLDTEGVIQGWSHVGFISSFGGQTDKVKASMQELVGKPIASGMFTSGASVVVTTGLVSTLLDDTKAAYDVLAAKSIEDILKENLAQAVTAGALTDAEIDAATRKEEFSVTAGSHGSDHIIEFANGDFGFALKYNNGWATAKFFIRTDATGNITKYAKLSGYYGTDGVCGLSDCGNAIVEASLQSAATNGVNMTAFAAPTITGGTAPDTVAAMPHLATLLNDAWTGRS